MQQLAPDVWTHSIDAEGFPTLTAVILTLAPRDHRGHAHRAAGHGPRRRVPRRGGRTGRRRRGREHAPPLGPRVRQRRLRGRTDIVAQRGCPRLIQAELQGGDESLHLPPPEGVPLPNVTFGDRLTYTDEGESVHLIHTPGHSEDSLVVFLTERRLLFGGDTVEWPLPSFCQRDCGWSGCAPCVSSSSCRPT